MVIANDSIGKIAEGGIEMKKMVQLLSLIAVSTLAAYWGYASAPNNYSCTGVVNCASGGTVTGVDSRGMQCQCTVNSGSLYVCYPQYANSCYNTFTRYCTGNCTTGGTCLAGFSACQ